MSQNNYPNQLPPQFAQQSHVDEIDLKALFLALWKGKWIIVATTFVFAVGAVLFAISQPNTYKADTLLAPAESSGQGGLAKMAGATRWLGGTGWSKPGWWRKQSNRSSGAGDEVSSVCRSFYSKA